MFQNQAHQRKKKKQAKKGNMKAPVRNYNAINLQRTLTVCPRWTPIPLPITNLNVPHWFQELQQFGTPVGQVRQVDFASDVTLPGQTVQQPAPVIVKTKPLISKKAAKKKRLNAVYTQANNVVNVYHSGSLASQPSQYQAPDHDEPEDLTDDLAPNMAGQNVQQQSGSQPRTVATENKLNFKFQKTTTKTPDWSEYQNKFRRIGGGSPDNEPDAPEVKQEPNRDQSINTGFIFEEDVEMKEVTINTKIDTSDLKVAVTTEPYQYLTIEQVKEIHEALVKRIQDIILNNNFQSYIPAFEDMPVHNLGHLPLTCQGPKDLFWLHETLASIPTPIPNVKLVIMPQFSVPNMIQVRMSVPNFSGDLEELRYLLKKQNHWYDMSSWTLINSQKQGDDPSSYMLHYRVPEKEALIIHNRDRRVAYSLGSCFAILSDDDTEKVFNHRNVAKHLQVCVVTEPFRYLTLLEVELIRLGLNYKLEQDVYKDERVYIPSFRGCPCQFKGGLKLWAESDRDLKWLKDTVASLVSPVMGTTLAVIEQTVMPYRAKINVFVPSAEEESVIVKVLKSQNTWCDVDSWVLFSTRLDYKTQGVICVFYVPRKHVMLIREKKCRLTYLLGYVNVDITSLE